MKWIVRLRERIALGDKYSEKDISVSDPLDLKEAVEIVEILMKPSMFGNEELWKISMEPVKERGDKNV